MESLSVLETEKLGTKTKIPMLMLIIGVLLILPEASLTLITLQQTSAQLNQMSTPTMLLEEGHAPKTAICVTTEPTIQGPEYKANPQFKEGKSFAKGLVGPRLQLTGFVFNRECNPVEGAMLNIWQANSNGKYDLEGFDLRGKIKTDKDGRYVLNTIYPKGSASHPSHIHVMVGIPGQPVITTQVYFEGQPRDSAVKDQLITNVTKMTEIMVAHFDFIVEDYREATK